MPYNYYTDYLEVTYTKNIDEGRKCKVKELAINLFIPFLFVLRIIKRHVGENTVRFSAVCSVRLYTDEMTPCVPMLAGPTRS